MYVSILSIHQLSNRQSWSIVNLSGNNQCIHPCSAWGRSIVQWQRLSSYNRCKKTDIYCPQYWFYSSIRSILGDSIKSILGIVWISDFPKSVAFEMALYWALQTGHFSPDFNSIPCLRMFRRPRWQSQNVTKIGHHPNAFVTAYIEFGAVIQFSAPTMQLSSGSLSSTLMWRSVCACQPPTIILCLAVTWCVWLYLWLRFKSTIDSYGPVSKAVHGSTWSTAGILEKFIAVSRNRTLVKTSCRAPAGSVHCACLAIVSVLRK